MADLVIQKMISIPQVSQNKTYTSFGAGNDAKNQDRTPKQVLSDNKTNILAGGLITGGAVLLYMGLTRPGSKASFNKFINSQIREMEKAVNKFADDFGKKVESAFEKTYESISDYRKTHIVKPADYLVQVNAIRDAEKLVEAQDITFDALNSAGRSLGEFRINPMDEFSVRFNREKTKVLNESARDQNRVVGVLKDCSSLPEGTKIDEDLLSSGAKRLVAAKDNFIDYMEKVRETKLNIVSKFQYRQMADAVTESRLAQARSKEAVLDKSFEKLREILKSDSDLVPLYEIRRYDLSGEKSLSNMLKVHRIPKKVQKNFEPSVFMKTVAEKDLNELSQKDIEGIYIRIQKGYNLKDLRYLIDRVRLHGAVCSADPKLQNDARAYKYMEVKLEYLSNLLNDYGERALLKACDCDLGKLNDGQKEAKLYYISRESRRLGYENFGIMNEAMLKTSEEYQKLGISKYADYIEENPELFFMG